jgi:hypothetical protein
MKTTHTIKAVVASGLLLLGLGMFKDAHAVPGNPDTMLISVTPSGVNYAVTITSPEVQGYDFAQVNVGATTISTKPIAVQNSGNISEFFSLAVNDITGGGNAWTNSTSPANVTYTMQGQFVPTAAAQPGDATFAGAGNNLPTAAPGTASGKFNQGATRTLPLASKDLWLQLQMPTGVAENGQHTLVLAITGQTN